MNHPPPTIENICHALTFISPDIDRNDWLKIATAIKTELANGFDIFDEWSKNGINYNKHDTKDTWKSAVPGAVQINTLFFFAKENGWKLDTSAVPETEEQRLKREQAKATQQAKAAKSAAIKAQNAVKKALELCKIATLAQDDHPYLLKKAITAPTTLLECPDEQTANILGYEPTSKGNSLLGRLLIAPIEIDGKLSTVEFIDEMGRKSAIAGGIKSTGYWADTKLPEGDGAGTIFFIAEGMATAVSAKYPTVNHTILNQCQLPSALCQSPAIAIAAFSDNNLPKVATALKKRYPAAQLIILADLGNGQSNATFAASKSNAQLAVPIFSKQQTAKFKHEQGKKPTDFNDLHLINSLENQENFEVETLENQENFEVETLENQENFEVETLENQENFEFEDNWKQELLDHVNEFNRNHAQVIVGGKHRIMREVTKKSGIYNRTTYEFILQSTLDLIYQNTTIKTGEKPLKYTVKEYFSNHISAWAKHPLARVYRNGIIFKPNAEPIDGYFNTWQGFAVKPKQNTKLWCEIKTHIEYILCDQDPILIEYFYNWVAYTFQNPDKQAKTAMVFRGEKGSGKGTIAKLLMNIWANHAFHISSAKHLTGNFNAHLANTCFLFADEAFFSGDRTNEGVLKAIITEDFLTVEMKGIDAVQQPNYLKIFMATNSDWAVPATKDERRYAVYDVSSVAIGDMDYFDKLRKDIANPDVQAAFLYDMLNRDISKFHIGQIPESKGLKDQRMHSLPNHAKWLIDCFYKGSFDSNDAWQGEVLSNDLWISYIAWCDTQKIDHYGRITQNKFGRYLADLGFTRRKTMGIIKWNFGTLAQTIQQFQQYEKVDLEIDLQL